MPLQTNLKWFVCLWGWKLDFFIVGSSHTLNFAKCMIWFHCIQKEYSVALLSSIMSWGGRVCCVRKEGRQFECWCNCWLLTNCTLLQQQEKGDGLPPKYPLLWGAPGSPYTSHHLTPPIPHHYPGASASPNQLTPPDPFTRKVSRLPKKLFTQSSSRFQPQKPPPDYKPLPHLKGKQLSCLTALVWMNTVSLTRSTSTEREGSSELSNHYQLYKTKHS